MTPETIERIKAELLQSEREFTALASVMQSHIRTMSGMVSVIQYMARDIHELRKVLHAETCESGADAGERPNATAAAEVVAETLGRGASADR